MKHPNEPAMRMAFTLVTVLAVIFASVMAGWAATDPIPAVPPVERAAPIRIVLRPPVIRHAPVNPGQIQQNATSDIALTQLLAENRCLAEVMYFEARGEGALGERAVAEVILRRLAVGTHGLTICGVVYEGANQTFCQFTFVCDGSLHKPKDAEAWRAAQVLAARLLAGELPGEETDGATYYHSISTHPTWAAKMVRVAQIGSHLFYKPVSPALAPLDVSFRGPLQ